MSLESLVLRGRAFAERLFVDSCTVKRKTGETTDPNSGVVTPTYSTKYTGKCRVQQRAAGTDTEVGEAHLVLVRHEVQLPMSVTDVREGDRIDITASALDPALVGRVFAVRDVAAKTHLTARRVGVVEVTS